MEGIAGVLGMLRVGFWKPPGFWGALLVLLDVAPADSAEKRCRSAAALAACAQGKGEDAGTAEQTGGRNVSKVKVQWGAVAC
jgi:hypothetical protein